MGRHTTAPDALKTAHLKQTLTDFINLPTRHGTKILHTCRPQGQATRHWARRPAQRPARHWGQQTAADAWTWWIVGLFGCPASCCMSCVRAPWTWGLFMCFCALFSLLNVEEVYNEQSPCCNCNSLTSHPPSCTVSLWGGPARSSPLYHYGFEARTASQRLRRCCLQWRRGHAVRAALAVGARSAPTAIRTFRLQCADCGAQ